MPTGIKRPALIWCMLLAGCLGLAGYLFKYSDVFPSASIDLKVSRRQILDDASKLADQLGYKSAGTIKSTVFSYDDDAKTFLEHELGLASANALMKGAIPVWYWSSRLCRPLNLEEFVVALSPGGKIVSFDHTIGNDLALPSMPHAEARKLAVDFITARAGLKLDTYKSIEDGSITQPNRIDHYFTWEDTGNEYAGARLRTYIYISGNKITAFNHFLHIPETWIRKFNSIRSYNKALEEVAGIFYAILNAATFFAFLWMFARGSVRWKPALVLAAVVAVMDYLDSLNSMPVTLRNYATTMSYNGFLLDIYVSAFWSALGQFMHTLPLAGAAEALYRLAYGEKLALENIFSRAGLRCRQVVSGLVAGHAMFGIHLGWIITYYLLGQPLHFWSPLEVRNADSLSAVVPAFSAMNIGLTAAVYEELTYRVLGTSIFQKLTGRFWLANLLQAAAWAFMHSNYPQEPAYARGVELTAVGLLYGFVMRRWGLLPCLVSHYVFDAFLSVTPLINSSLLLIKASSFAAVCPFAAYLAAAAWFTRKGNYICQGKLINSSLPAARAQETVEEILPAAPYQYQGLSAGIRKILLLVGAGATIIQFGFHFPLINQKASLELSRQQAIERARLYMLNRKLPPFGRSETAWVAAPVNSQELQYIFEKAKFKEAASLSMNPGHPLVWRVRFFKALDPQEYLVTLDGTGKLISIDVTCAEDAPGAHLTEAQARSLAERYLSLEHAELNPCRFDSVRREEKKARTDYRFTFKAPKFDVPGAAFKASVHVTGSIISAYDQFWDLPDKWVFERSRHTTKDQMCGYLVATVALALLIAVIWWVIGVARSGAIHWRMPIMLGLMMSLLVIPETLNNLSEFYVAYATDTPLVTYYIAQTVRQIMTALQIIAAVVGLAAFSLASFRLLFPRVTIAAILRSGISRTGLDRRTQFNFWLDAVLCGYAAGIGSRAFTVLLAWVHVHTSPVATASPLAGFCNLANMSSPALDSIMDSFTRGMQTVLLSGILAGLYAKYFKSWRSYLLFAAAISLIYPCTNRYWQDYLIDVLNDMVYFLAAWIFLKKLARQNIASYFLAGATGMLAGSLRLLIAHGPGLFQKDIAILAIVLASPAIYLFYLYGNKADSATRPVK